MNSKNTKEDRKISVNKMREEIEDCPPNFHPSACGTSLKKGDRGTRKNLILKSPKFGGFRGQNFLNCVSFVREEIEDCPPSPPISGGTRKNLRLKSPKFGGFRGQNFLNCVSFVREEIEDFVLQLRFSKLTLFLFSLLCLNVIVAPAVQAATGSISRGQSYALGLLGLVTFSLFIYLFAVIFQPEKF
jgi:K+-transporting ATPase KdpF subunit